MTSTILYYAEMRKIKPTAHLYSEIASTNGVSLGRGYALIGPMADQGIFTQETCLKTEKRVLHKSKIFKRIFENILAISKQKCV